MCAIVLTKAIISNGCVVVSEQKPTCAGRSKGTRPHLDQTSWNYRTTDRPAYYWVWRRRKFDVAAGLTNQPADDSLIRRLASYGRHNTAFFAIKPINAAAS
ncbi:MAG: hypothetical protein ACKER6_00855 [Candidatus Hodgkinia cicadicola]